jgi:hypothetical protein
MGEPIDIVYRTPVSGEEYGILNVACADSAIKYAITIPSRYKKINIRATDGATFKFFKTSAATHGVTVLANGQLDIEVAGIAGIAGYVQFAAATKVAEVLYIV